jgi:hypothetical protein
MHHFHLLDLQTKTQMIGLFCTPCSYNKQAINTKKYFKCAPPAKTTGRGMDFSTTTQQHNNTNVPGFLHPGTFGKNPGTFVLIAPV